MNQTPIDNAMAGPLTGGSHEPTFSGVPSNLARSFSSWVHTPTGQVLLWHWRTMMHPIATSDAVPMPKSSAPSMAAITTSRPVLMPPSVRSRTVWRSRLSIST